jgi:signal transduction histidine kinase
MALLFQGVADELRERQPSQRELTLNVGALPPIVADASLVRHVFVNLLSNALRPLASSLNYRVIGGGARGLHNLSAQLVAFDQ